MNSTQHLESDSSELEEPSPLPFVLPLILMLLLGMFAPGFEAEPTFDEGSALTAQERSELVEYTAERNRERVPSYVLLVAGQVVLAVGLFVYFYRTYLHHFPFRATFWSIVVGAVGCFLWVAICKLNLEHAVLQSVGLESWLPKRVGFNPGQIDSDLIRYFFLGVRFLVLALIIPVFEELFLRGWLIRFIDDTRWWKLQLGQLTLRACAVASVYGVISHLGEALAAFVWFSLVTLMMKRTGNFWDCVVAHMITNLLLGIWVLYSGDWYFW